MSKTVISKTNPVAPYLGGKRNLAKRICAIIDADNHTTYAEPFVGMGGIFLRRTKQPKSEYINDAGRDVYNLFRVLQEHYVAFLDMLRFQITTQANFIRLTKVDPETLTDLQRAARFLYLQRTAFGGKPSGQNFGVATDRPARFNLTTLESDLEALHERLSGVTIMCVDYSNFIARMDRKHTLFYLDPPYWGCENDYGKALFERADFERLAEQLKGIKGRFVMSINDVPEIRETFAAFHMSEVSTTYTIAAKNDRSKERAELLISNFVWEGT
ncbi:DNA adenine methylase [Planktotalea sp.]|uniref:DNA adenine methylase n=1 Tax=Planktotalea sp. TaxID=2029877 RepID=UPI003D6B009E